MSAKRRLARREDPLLRTTRTTAVLLFTAWAVDYIDRQVINLALPSIGDTFGLSHAERA